MSKETYLQQVEKDLQTNHPDNIPDRLLCFFSQDVIKDPVITNNDRVYSNQAIRRWLKNHNEDPFRTPLTEHDLHPFPELELLIERFKLSRRNFNKTKMKLQTEASQVDEDTRTIPELFKCSITGELMNKAFITADGQLVDESQLEHIHPVQAVEFTTFNEYLNYYLDNHIPQKQSTTPEATPTTPHSFLSSIYSFFGMTDEENKSDREAGAEHQPKQRM